MTEHQRLAREGLGNFLQRHEVIRDRPRGLQLRGLVAKDIVRGDIVENRVASYNLSQVHDKYAMKY